MKLYKELKKKLSEEPYKSEKDLAFTDRKFVAYYEQGQKDIAELIYSTLDLCKRKNEMDFHNVHITREQRQFCDSRLNTMLGKVFDKKLLIDYLKNPKYYSDEEYKELNLLFTKN